MSADLTLLHTNDMHNRRGVFDYLASRTRDASTLLVDCGDAIRGSNTVFHLHEPILDQMNAVAYDAMTMGNREFNYLRGVLRRRFRQIEFPFVVANVRDLRDKTNDVWRSTWVKTLPNGLRVGLVGVTPVQYPHHSPWESLFGFRFDAPLEILPPLVESLRAQSDVVILLSHSGFDLDCKIATDIAGIDVIVGGHSHTLLETPRFIGGTYIVQTGSYGRFVGEMTVDVKPGGGLEHMAYSLIPMASGEDERAGRRLAAQPVDGPHAPVSSLASRETGGAA